MAASASPFRTVWFYNSITGSVIDEPAIGDTIQDHLPGWHGPFASKQDALGYYTANKGANPGWKAPTGLAGNVGNEAGAAASAAAGGTLGAFRLTFGNTTGLLTRILKTGVGLVLLVAGILKLSGADRKLEQVIPVVGGPAGKVLAA